MKVSQPLPVTLPPYGVLFAESVHATDFRMAERADPFHKMIYVLDGEVSYREPRKPAALPVEAGTLLIVPRDVRHQIEDVRPSTLLLLCLAGNFLEADPDLPRLWLKLSKLPGRRLHLDRPARVRVENMWRRAMLEVAHARVGGAVSVRALAAQILVLLARLPTQAARDETGQRVAAVAREVEETFYDEWNLERAASRAGLSRRRFSELFRKMTGRTFWEHLNELRLAHAARLLRAGEHSISGVMFSCGFNDVTHFYRLFRARHGAPPRAWLADEGGARKRNGR
ncbi:MAG: helix-turn-helix domain-containing protein [Opitutaceae bacterium]